MEWERHRLRLPAVAAQSIYVLSETTERYNYRISKTSAIWIGCWIRKYM